MEIGSPPTSLAMTTALRTRAGPVAQTASPARFGFGGSIFRAPMVPVALALTAGIVFDRHAPVPLPLSLLALAAGLALAVVFLVSGPRGLALVYLCFGVAAAGAALHQGRRASFADDDISEHATAEPRPAV